MEEDRKQLKKRILAELIDPTHKGIVGIQKEYGIGFDLAKEIFEQVKYDKENYEKTFFDKRYPVDFFVSYFNYYCSFDCIDLELIDKDVDTLIKEIDIKQKEYKLLNEQERRRGRGGPLLLRIKILKLQILMNIEGIKLFKPDIYQSYADEIIVCGYKKLLLPLVCLKRMNLRYATRIVEERGKGEFTSYEDFRRRIGISSYRIEWLINNGYLKFGLNNI